MQRIPLGALSAAQFMQRHWQRRPLRVRGAVPELAGLLGRDELFALAARDAVESRRVEFDGRQWHLEHGPFDTAKLRRGSRHPWTVLVQGVDLHHDGAHALLQRFDFLPWARLDDVMVSYASDGGGVGPHFDSYDVFLLQGAGRRRWRIGAQRDLALVPDAPLRLLADFRPSREWILEPGDLLYLPPHYAHEGVALGPCMTWSVGFRAASDAELFGAFLDFLHQRVAPAGRYTDRGSAPTARRGEVPAALLAHARRALERVRWKAGWVDEFVGCHLSEPKPDVVFVPPTRPLSAARFARALARRGLRLDRKTRLLYRGARLFLNGEAYAPVRADRAALRRLADTRALPPGAAPTPATLALLHQWYREGCCHLNEGAP